MGLVAVVRQYLLEQVEEDRLVVDHRDTPGHAPLHFLFLFHPAYPAGPVTGLSAMTRTE